LTPKYLLALQQRQAPLELTRAALLLVDTQNYNCHPNGVLGSQMQARRPLRPSL